MKRCIALLLAVVALGSSVELADAQTRRRPIRRSFPGKTEFPDDWSGRFPLSTGTYVEAADAEQWECDDEDAITIGVWWYKDSVTVDEALVIKGNSAVNYGLTLVANAGADTYAPSFAVGGVGNYCRGPALDEDAGYYYTLFTLNAAVGSTTEEKIDGVSGRAGVEPTDWESCASTAGTIPTVILNSATPLSIGRVSGLSSFDYGPGSISEVFIACTGKISFDMARCLLKNGRPQDVIACGLPNLRVWLRFGDTPGDSTSAILNAADNGATSFAVTGTFAIWDIAP